MGIRLASSGAELHLDSHPTFVDQRLGEASPHAIAIIGVQAIEEESGSGYRQAHQAQGRGIRIQGEPLGIEERYAIGTTLQQFLRGRKSASGMHRPGIKL